MIPEHYVVKLDKQELASKKNITIRRYGTSIPFKQKEIEYGLESSRLQFGNEFGVIKNYQSNENDSIRSLWGIVGEKNLALLNDETDELNFIKIKHVLTSTIMVEFFCNQDGQLELLLYGGREAKNRLWKMLEHNFTVIPSPVQRHFEEDAVRELCESYFDMLRSINISPEDQDGWEAINIADFKSYPGRFLQRTVERMQQIYDNKNIRFTAFESTLDDQIMKPSMQKPCNVQFKLLKDSGITLSFPPLEISPTLDDLESESVLYDFAREIYGKIIGDTNLYSYVKTYMSQQHSLFAPNDT